MAHEHTFHLFIIIIIIYITIDLIKQGAFE